MIRPRSIALAVLTLSGAAGAEPTAEQIADCATVEDCLSILVAAADNRYGVWWEANEDIAHLLKQRFGEEARDALLELALSDRREAQNLAGGVLSVWGDWRPEHVSQLDAALEVRSSGWIARPLGEIGAPEAIDALVRDLARGASRGQTDWVLQQLPPTAVLPRMLPALAEVDDPQYDGPDRALLRGAQGVILGYGDEADVMAPEWSAIALDPDEERWRRLAALRGLAPMGASIREQTGPIRDLMSAPDADLALEAYYTLASVGDPVVAERNFLDCLTPAEATGSEWLRPRQEALCIADLARFGGGDGSVGALLLPYLSNPSSEVRAATAFALGELRFRAAGEQIARSLHSPDWREVVAALQALEWLGDPAIVPAVRDVEETHWWPAIRTVARNARLSLANAGPPLEETLSDTDILADRYHRYTDDAADCPSGVWDWRGARIRFGGRARDRDATTARFPDGRLIGTDAGEWIGELAWEPRAGRRVVLWNDNISHIFRSRRGALALAGLSHLGLSYGYILRAERDPTGWRVEVVGQLPDDYSSVVSLSRDRHAVVSRGWVVVFSDAGIEGVATCVK